MPQQNVVHIDQALTNLSIAYKNDDYVAGMVLPQITVDKKSNKYFVYGKEHLRYRESRIRPGATADEFEYTLSTNAYFAERRARRHLITDNEVMMSDNPLAPQADSTEVLADTMMLVLEFDVATFLTSSSNMTNNTALSGVNRWDDYVNSAPLTNFKTARISVRLNALKRANVAVIPYDVGLTLADHPSIKDLIKYTDPKSLTSAGLPPVIRGLTVIEPAAVYDNSVEGRSFSPVGVWGKNAIIAYITPSPGRRVLSLGYTFVAPDEVTGATGLSTRSYRDEPRAGTWIETSVTYDPRLVSVGSGYLYQTVIN